MTHARLHAHARFRTGGAAWWRLLILVAATLVGLVAMHQLAGAVGSAHAHAASGAHAGTAGQACEHPGDCPDDPHGHPGQVCQANPTTTTAGEAPQPLAHPPAPVLPPSVTPSTADRDARDGSGCGPPSRALLSIWRI